MTDPSALYAGVRWRRLTSAFGVDLDIRSWREAVITWRFNLLCLPEAPEDSADPLPNRGSHGSLDNHICNWRRAC